MQRGFSLLEMMIALALGITVTLVAMAGFRTGCLALTTAQQLERENHLLATGITYAYQELDQWSLYDDRSNTMANRQPLRNTYSLRAGSVLKNQDVISNQSDSTSSHQTKTPYLFGLPFTLMNHVWGPRTLTSDVPAGLQNYGATPPGQDTNWLSESNQEDGAWAIAADNRLTWWTGNFSPGLASTRSMALTSDNLGNANLRRGYYNLGGVSGIANSSGIFTNTIGYGLNVFQTQSSQTAINSPTGKGLGSMNVTGVTGQSPAYGSITYRLAPDAYAVRSTYHDNANVMGWVFNQMRGLQTSLGFYGLIEYLPVGMIPAYMQAYAHKSTDPTNLFDASSWSYAMDIGDWDGFPLYLTYGGGNANTTLVSGTSITLAQLANCSFFNFRMSLEVDHQYGAYRTLPTRASLLAPGGFSLIPWCNSWDQGGWSSAIGASVPNPLVQPFVSAPTTSANALVFYHRSYFCLGDSDYFSNDPGNGLQSLVMECDPTSLMRSLSSPGITAVYGGDWNGNRRQLQVPAIIDPMIVTRFQGRTTGTMRLTSTRPLNWPDVNVSVARHLRSNQFINLATVSVTDPATGKSYNLRFSALGTTLRGARRQRDLDR